MTTKKEYQSILVIVIGLLLCYLLFRQPFLWIAALTIGSLSVLFPVVRTAIVKTWFRIAEVLGFINSRILLSVIFYLILFPLALISRLFSKDKMQLKKKDSAEESYYTTRIHRYTPEDFDNPW